MHKPSISEIVELAMEVNKEDPIDFGLISINEEDSFNLVALSLLENESFFDSETGPTIMLASLTKLIVDNMILNIKLMDLKKLH